MARPPDIGDILFVFTQLSEVLYAISINFTDIREASPGQQGDFIRGPASNRPRRMQRAALSTRRSPSKTNAGAGEERSGGGGGGGGGRGEGPSGGGYLREKNDGS